MERPNNVIEGLVWLADQINQSEVDFAPRFVVHNKNEHRIYFYSDKVTLVTFHGCSNATKRFQRGGVSQCVTDPPLYYVAIT